MRSTMSLIVAVAAILGACSVAAGGRDNELTPSEVLARQRAGTALVVDVRSGAEFEACHVAGAVNVPLGEIERRAVEIRRLALERDIVLYCRSGRRAMMAEAILRERGVGNVFHLVGQIAGWAAEGLPVERSGRATLVGCSSGSGGGEVDRTLRGG